MSAQGLCRFSTVAFVLCACALHMGCDGDPRAARCGFIENEIVVHVRTDGSPSSVLAHAEGMGGATKTSIGRLLIFRFETPDLARVAKSELKKNPDVSAVAINAKHCVD